MQQQQRPAPVMVIAVLNFIFGGMGVFGAFCGGVGILGMVILAQNAPPVRPGQPNPIKEIGDLFQSIPGYIPFLIISLILGLIMSIVLIVAGIGLIRMRNWGRILSFVFAIYTILSTLGGLVYTFTYVNPAMEKWTAQMQAKAGPGAPPPNPAGNIGGAIGGVVGAVFNISYAIMIFVFLNLASVRRAFAVAAGGATDMDDTIERDWNRDEGEYPGEGRGRLRSDDDRLK